MRTLAALILGVAVSTSVALAVDVDAITRPSDDVTLSFPQAGKVANVLVKDGQAVKADQVLLQQDDSAEQQMVAQLKAEADSPVRVDASIAKLEQTKLDLVKTQKAADTNAATPMELEHAKLEVIIDGLTVTLSKVEHEEARLKYEEARLRVERMAIRSPFAGKVERVAIKQGEGAEAMAKVIRVVKIDPLWIDVPAPLTSANAISLGDSLRLQFPNHGSEESAVGKVIFKGAVADAASDTLLVRLEVPNPSRRAAGERVKVNVSDVIPAPAPATEPAAAVATEPAADATTAPAAEVATQPSPQPAMLPPADAQPNQTTTQPSVSASIQDK